MYFMESKQDREVIVPKIFPEIKQPTLEFMKSLNEKRRKEYNKWKVKQKLIKKIGKGTLIIGIRAKDGIVIVSDRKVMRGAESDYEDKIKIFEIQQLSAPIIFAAAGYVGVADDFLETFQKSLEYNVQEEKINSILDVKFLAEDILIQFEERYAPRLEEYPIQFMLGGLEGADKGPARLYIIGPRGYSEKIKFFEMIGHGSNYARTIAKFLLPREKIENISIEKATLKALAGINWISGGIDDYVGVILRLLL